MANVLKSVFERSEFDVPTSFVILSYPIETEETKAIKGKVKLASDGLDKAGKWMSRGGNTTKQEASRDRYFAGRGNKGKGKGPQWSEALQWLNGSDIWSLMV